jgi:hypothetical protein
VLLGFAFLRDDIVEMAWFRRFGWWIAVALVIAATAPGAYFRAFGGGMGGIAVLMAIGAAVLNMLDSKKAAPAKAPPQS